MKDFLAKEKLLKFFLTVPKKLGGREVDYRKLRKCSDSGSCIAVSLMQILRILS